MSTSNFAAIEKHVKQLMIVSKDINKRVEKIDEIAGKIPEGTIKRKLEKQVELLDKNKMAVTNIARSLRETAKDLDPKLRRTERTRPYLKI